MGIIKGVPCSQSAEGTSRVRGETERKRKNEGVCGCVTERKRERERDPLDGC